MSNINEDIRYTDITVNSEEESAKAYEHLLSITEKLKQWKEYVETGLILGNKISDAIAAFEYRTYGEVRVLETLAMMTTATRVIQ
jgi:hypothetical protein